MAESTPIWGLAPARILDKNAQPLPDSAVQELALQAGPLHAPTDWRIPLDSGGPDSQGLWTRLFPLGLPLHLESLPWSCGGTGTWWSGFLDFTPSDPPPAAPPLLKLLETPLPPCVPAALGATPGPAQTAPPTRPRNRSTRE